MGSPVVPSRCDRRDVAVAVVDGDEAVLGVVGELGAHGAGEGVERLFVAAGAAEDVDLAAVGRGDENVARRDARQRGGDPPDALVEGVGDVDGPVRPDGDRVGVAELRLGREAAVAAEPGEAVAGDRRDDAFGADPPQTLVAGVRDVDAAVGADREADRRIDLGGRRRAAVAAESGRRAGERC